MIVSSPGWTDGTGEKPYRYGRNTGRRTPYPEWIRAGPDPRAPVAKFTLSRSSGTAPLYVRFAETSTARRPRGGGTSAGWPGPRHEACPKSDAPRMFRSPGHRDSPGLFPTPGRSDAQPPQDPDHQEPHDAAGTDRNETHARICERRHGIGPRFDRRTDRIVSPDASVTAVRENVTVKISPITAGHRAWPRRCRVPGYARPFRPSWWRRPCSPCTAPTLLHGRIHPHAEQVPGAPERAPDPPAPGAVRQCLGGATDRNGP